MYEWKTVMGRDGKGQLGNCFLRAVWEQSLHHPVCGHGATRRDALGSECMHASAT